MKEDRAIPIDLETVGEARIVTQALAGSQSAFEQIVRRYQRPIISLIARMTGDAPWPRTSRRRPSSKPSATSRRSTRRGGCRAGCSASPTTPPSTRCAARGRRTAAIAAEAGSRAAPRRARHATRGRSGRTRELGRALEAALAELRPDQRAAIVLRYESGLSFDEIGTVLGVPEATARSHVHRARKELARLLTGSGWAPAE